MKGYKIMKRNILSILLACVMIVSAFLLVGCNTDELEAKYNELGANQTKVESSLKDATAKTEAEIQAAAKKATDDLAVAQAKLEKLIEDSEAASAAELNAAIEEFNAAIEAVEETLADANANLSAELEKKFAEELASAVETAQKALTESSKKSIEDLRADLAEAIAAGDAATAEDIKATIAESVEKLAAIDKVVTETAIELDGVLKAEVLDAVAAEKAALVDMIEDLRDDVNEAVEALNERIDNAVEIDKWEETTVLVIEAVQDLYDAFYAVEWDSYYAAEQAEIETYYDTAYVKLLRLRDAGENGANIDAILDEFDAAVAEVMTKAEYIESVLTELGEYEDIEHTSDWDDNISDAEDLIAKELVDGVVPEWLEDVADMAEDFRDRYIEVAGADYGYDLYEEMVRLNGIAVDFTDKDYLKDVADLRTNYEEWLANPEQDNVTMNEEIFGADDFAVVKAFEVKEARIEALTSAAEIADKLNVAMEALLEDIAQTSVSNDNAVAYSTLTVAVEKWAEDFFSAPYDVEKVADNNNWNLLDHELWAKVVEAYGEATALFEANAHPYIYAVENLGEVNLFTYDEIAHAKAMYKRLVEAQEFAVYSQIFAEKFNKSAAQTYNDLLATEVEYAALVNEALASYLAAFEGVKDMTTENVTIYDGAAIDAILEWYDDNTAKDAEGNPLFTNYLNNVLDVEPSVYSEGYVLSEDVLVNSTTYASVVELKTAYDALVAAKEAEGEEVDAAIDAIAAILTNKELDASTACKDAIEAAEKALAAWKSGENAPEGFAAAQFAITAAAPYAVDEADLVDARAYYDFLMGVVETIKEDIELLPAYNYSYDIADQVVRDNYAANIAAIRKAIDEFAPMNDNIPAEENFDLTKLDAGELAIARYDAYVKTKAEHDLALDNAVATLAGAHDDVLAIVANALDVVLENHVAEINKAPTVAECNAGLALAVAKYTVADDIIAAYLRVYAVMDEDKAALFADDAAKAAAFDRVETAVKNAFELHIIEDATGNFETALVLIEVEELRAPYNDLAEAADVVVEW